MVRKHQYDGGNVSNDEGDRVGKAAGHEMSATAIALDKTVGHGVQCWGVLGVVPPAARPAQAKL
jgi:hypothetical protein